MPRFLQRSTNNKKQVSIDGSKMNIDEWTETLFFATNPTFETILLQTSEDDIAFDILDSIYSHPPLTIAGRLVAFLYKRFLYFEGQANKGVTVVTSDLSTDETAKLDSAFLEFAHINNLDPAFMDWFEDCINFFHPSSS